MEPTFRSPFSYGISNSGKRLPRNGLLIYLARPNSDEHLVGEDTEIGEDTYIWGYVLPDDADIRAATGWAGGTANVFYTATGVPIVALATEIAAAVLPANVVFSLVDATMQTGKLAIYTAETTAATLAKARSVLRDDSINYLFYGRTAIAYDSQDLATMYQDSQGTLPAYRPGSGAVDPPVGLALDKSRGLELGPELWAGGGDVAIYNGSSTPANGIFDISTGELSNTSAGASLVAPIFSWEIGIKSETFYVVQVQFSGSIDKVYSVCLTNATATPNFTSGGISGSTIASAGGAYTWVGKCAASYGTARKFSINTDGRTTWDGLFIESISVREIKGYHAYQTTTTARPTLSGRYNLLTATETLSTQSVTTAATNYTLRFEGTGTVTLSGTATGTYSAGTHTITCTAGSLTLTVAGSVTKADLRVANDGVGLPPYQRVDDANTYDTNGFPLYLKFDGVDDFLQTANVDFAGVESICTSVGVRKTGVGGVSEIIYETGSGMTAGGIDAVTSNGSTNYYLVRAQGLTNSAQVQLIPTVAHVPPSTNVLVASFDGVSDASSLRCDGVKGPPLLTNDLSGGFGNRPLYVGARAGTSLYFNGRIYQLCIIGDLLSPSEQAVLERYLNAKTRAY